jgi:hypothetical protein
LFAFLEFELTMAHLSAAELCSMDFLQEAVGLITKLAVHATPSTALSRTPLSLDGRMQTENNETVSALIGATRGEDSVTISHLSSLGELQGSVTAMSAGPATLPRSPPVLPHVASDTTVLGSCQLDIESMQHAQNLRDAIEQVESRAVGRIHECYGPRYNRAAEAMWGHLKGKVTKREQLYGPLAGTFEGDKENFFQFFTVSAPMDGKKQ